MVKFEKISIIGIIVFMSIVSMEAKTAAIFNIQWKHATRYLKHFENGFYTPAKTEMITIDEHVTKLIFQITHWKILHVVAGEAYINNLNKFNRFITDNRPNVRAFFISFGKFEPENYRPYVIQLIRMHFKLDKKSVEIIDDELNDQKFTEMYSPYHRSNDAEIRNELNKLLHLENQPITKSVVTNRCIPIQLNTQNKEIRIYDPFGEPILETLPMRIINNVYQTEKVYSYTNSFPDMATAIFIAHGETFIDTLGGERDLFDSIAKELMDDSLKTHLIMFGAFNIPFKEIKHIAEMVHVHYGKVGQPQKDVFILGEGIYDTIFECHDGKFHQIFFQKLLDFRNAIHRSRPPRSINLYAPTKMSPPYFKHFDIQTVNGIYKPNRETSVLTYIDLGKGRDTLLFFILDGSFYDYIGASHKSKMEFIDIVRQMEIDLSADMIIMFCNNFGGADGHIVSEFLPAHALYAPIIVVTMGYQQFNQHYQHENCPIGYLDVELDKRITNFLFGILFEQSQNWRKPSL